MAWQEFYSIGCSLFRSPSPIMPATKNSVNNDLFFIMMAFPQSIPASMLAELKVAGYKRLEHCSSPLVLLFQLGDLLNTPGFLVKSGTSQTASYSRCACPTANTPLPLFGVHQNAVGFLSEPLRHTLCWYRHRSAVMLIHI